MADVNAEPSMEEILSSIKRIIAEEEGTPARRRPPVRPATLPPAEEEDADATDGVLELSHPVPADVPAEPAARVTGEAPAPEPARTGEPILSAHTADATRGSLESLSRLIVRPDARGDGDGTLEGLVRELLKPMLREWLDARLPGLVETMVSREIARISGRGL